MGSLTLLQTVLMAIPFFLSLTFNSLPLNCNNIYDKRNMTYYSGKKCGEGPVSL